MNHQLNNEDYLVQNMYRLNVAQLKVLFTPKMLESKKLINAAIKSGDAQKVEYLLGFNTIPTYKIDDFNAVGHPEVLAMIIHYGVQVQQSTIKELFFLQDNPCIKVLLERNVQPAVDTVLRSIRADDMQTSFQHWLDWGMDKNMYFKSNGMSLLEVLSGAAYNDDYIQILLKAGANTDFLEKLDNKTQRQQHLYDKLLSQKEKSLLENIETFQANKTFKV